MIRMKMRHDQPRDRPTTQDVGPDCFDQFALDVPAVRLVPTGNATRVKLDSGVGAVADHVADSGDVLNADVV